jgi:hypothetical protein
MLGRDKLEVTTLNKGIIMDNEGNFEKERHQSGSQ